MYGEISSELGYFNIFNKKIIDLETNNYINKNIIGGGINKNGIQIKTLIGLIFIIIGFVLIWDKKDFVETNGLILNTKCYTNDECKLNIKYTVRNIEYSKIISVSKNDLSKTNFQKIYYSDSEPNLISSNNNDYSIFGFGFILIGILAIYL